VRGFATYGIGGFYEGLQSEPEQEKHNVYRVDPQTGSVTVVVEQHGATDLARRAARIVGDHHMSRPAASARFHRSTTRPASSRAAASAAPDRREAAMSWPRVRTPIGAVSTNSAKRARTDVTALCAGEAGHVEPVLAMVTERDRPEPITRNP
jgi:hypothetical protein